MNNKIKTKINRNTFMINGDSEEDNKKREIIKNILINEENKNKSDLHNYFLNNKEEAIQKHIPYFDIYERHFSKYRGKDINLLEIGVGYGGSLKMWKNYFSKLNPNAKVNIYGIDKKERCKKFEVKKSKTLKLTKFDLYKEDADVQSKATLTFDLSESLASQITKYTNTTKIYVGKY